MSSQFEDKEQELINNKENSEDSFLDFCIICCEPYTSSSHSAVTLRCGHLFGKNCVEKWLDSDDARRRCPTCNQQSNLNDIRVIHPKTILAKNTFQTLKNFRDKRDLLKFYKYRIEELKFDLGNMKKENNLLEKEIKYKDELIKKLNLLIILISYLFMFIYIIYI